MAIIIYILTILLAVATFFIIKNKRYKVVPLVSWVIIIFFIGCVFISIVSLFVPYGEILVLPLGSIVLGFVVILAAFNDFYSLIRCKDKIEGIYRGYNTYYGGNGVSTQAPVFEYISPSFSISKIISVAFTSFSFGLPILGARDWNACSAVISISEIKFTPFSATSNRIAEPVGARFDFT